ncbi:unnamed protein product [Sphenostylis stenocarpa]|uniref:Uncharacterized protein n=1 Tax=Sphenostylis stenocarpa TaxID=92480 RepID=A0AA86RZV7_9FABA|nr:unnamed protein product [Sphenostylis stenocarpa]
MSHATVMMERIKLIGDGKVIDPYIMSGFKEELRNQVLRAYIHSYTSRIKFRSGLGQTIYGMTKPNLRDKRNMLMKLIFDEECNMPCSQTLTLEHIIKMRLTREMLEWQSYPTPRGNHDHNALLQLQHLWVICEDARRTSLDVYPNGSMAAITDEWLEGLNVVALARILSKRRAFLRMRLHGALAMVGVRLQVLSRPEESGASEDDGVGGLDNISEEDGSAGEGEVAESEKDGRDGGDGSGEKRYTLGKCDTKWLHQLVMSATSALVGVCVQACVGTPAQKSKAYMAIGVAKNKQYLGVDDKPNLGHKRYMLTRLIFDEECLMLGSQSLNLEHVIEMFVKVEGHKDPTRAIFSSNLTKRQAHSWMEHDWVGDRHEECQSGRANQALRGN